MELVELKMLQCLPLDVKIMKTKQRIREWYEYWGGEVYISFSGGKDSTVLLDLVRSLYPDVVAVYCDTGLEFPEIKSFVKTIGNVVILRPKMNFKKVIDEYGYPVISKEIALTIDYARKGSKWAIDRLDGKHEYGNHKKYKFLLDAPFKITDRCCDIMKKKPFKLYEHETGFKPIIGTMAAEGGQRKTAYKRTGCNSFESTRPKSVPLGFWTEKDIWDYLKLYKIPYSRIYDMGYQRTGCMFCMFGAHLEKHPNRFQKMQLTHPKQYDYCIDKLGLDKVLDYIDVPYKNNIENMKCNGQKYQQYRIV